MNSQQFIFHIGMPKTATSFLQKNFYPQLDLAYLGKHYDSPIDSKKRDKEIAEAFKKIFFRQPYQVSDEEYENIRSLIPKESTTILYSNEEMVGSYKVSFCNGYQVAHHIKKGFPDAKIIYIFRRQDQFLESLYRQSLRLGYSLSVKRFLNYKKGVFRTDAYNTAGSIDLESFNYLKILRFYTDLFGKDNVLFLPYEMLKENRKLFLERICEFMETEYRDPISKEQTNIRDNYLLLSLLRILNTFISKRVQNRINDILFINRIGRLINRIPFDPPFLDSDIRKKIMEYYRASNRRLSTEFGMDYLERYGYF